jgi:transketolase
MATQQIDTPSVNTIRTLSMDAVQQANSGHPGTPMAMAPVAYCLWQKFLRFDPQDPIWPNRDRFVLSMGHASMLLYSMLHLTRVGDANDLDMLSRAFQTFQKTTDRPTLIIVDSHIAWGAPSKQDTHAAHGEPLGEEEIKGTKRNYGWPENEKFLVPGEVREHFKQGIGRRGKELRDAWMTLYEQYKAKYPKGHADTGSQQVRAGSP